MVLALIHVQVKTIWKTKAKKDHFQHIKIAGSAAMFRNHKKKPEWKPTWTVMISLDIC